MRHSIIFQSLLLIILVSAALAATAHFMLVEQMWERDLLLPARLWASLLALITIAGAAGYRRFWQQRQARRNEVMATAGQVYSLGPQRNLGRSGNAGDFWRRVPAAYFPRPTELPGSHLALELTSRPDLTLFGLCLPPGDSLNRAIREEIGREWPQTEIRPLAAHDLAIDASDEGEIFADPVVAAGLDPQTAVRWQTFRLKRPDVYPLHDSPGPVPGRGRSVDFQTALLGAVDAVHPQATVGVQLLVRPAPAAVARRWERYANRLRARLNAPRFKVMANPQGGRQYMPLPPLQNRDVLQRQLDQMVGRLADGHALCEVCLRAWAASLDPTLAEAELERLAAAITGAARGQANELVADERGEDAATLAGRHFPARGGFILTATDLGRLAHLPDMETAAPYSRLHRAGAAPLPPERRILVEPGQEAGRRIYGRYTYDSGDTILVGHAFAETRLHALLFGATGSGKSTCAESLALQDWLGGAGVLVIDPHMQLVDGILSHVPPHREDDVIVLEAGGRQPFRLNLCRIGRRGHEAIPAATNLALTVEYIMEAIAAGENASWETNVNMRDILYHAFLLALDTLGEEASILAVQRLLEDEKWRKKLLRRASFAAKPAVDFWEGSFSQMHQIDRNRALNAARTRVRTFTRSPIIRRTLAMPGATVDIGQALDAGKLVLAPMPDALGPEGKRLWGALLVREFLVTLMARQPGTGRRASLFVDELASSVGTVTEYIKRIITELRKYGGSGNFMTQSYAPFSPELQTLLKGQCITQIAFHGAGKDAEAAAQLIGDITPADVQNLRPFHAYARLAVNHSRSAPCLLRMLPTRRAGARPATNHQTLAMPEPPAEWAVLFTSAKMPPPFVGSTLKATIPELLAYIEQRLADDEAEVLDLLRALRPGELAALKETKQAYDRWYAAELRANPALIPDPVERLKRLSQLTIGVSWWLSEVEYQQAGAAAGEEDRRPGRPSEPPPVMRSS